MKYPAFSCSQGTAEKMADAAAISGTADKMAEAAAISIHEAAREGDAALVNCVLRSNSAALNSRDRLSRTPYPSFVYAFHNCGCFHESSQVEPSGGEARRGPMLHAWPTTGHLPAAVEVLHENRLHLAAWAGHADVVRILCDAGADVGAAAMDDMAAIHFASQKGHTEVVRTLLASGAYVNAKNRKGMTALHFAVQGSGEDLTKLLIKKGANLTTENKSGKKPVDLVRDPSLLAVIRDAQAERNARRAMGNKEKSTPGTVDAAGIDKEVYVETRPITVPERALAVPLKVENCSSLPGDMQRRTREEDLVTGIEGQGNETLEPSKKKPKVSLSHLSFDDSHDDERAVDTH